MKRKSRPTCKLKAGNPKLKAENRKGKGTREGGRRGESGKWEGERGRGRGGGQNEKRAGKTKRADKKREQTREGNRPQANHRQSALIQTLPTKFTSQRTNNPRRTRREAHIEDKSTCRKRKANKQPWTHVQPDHIH